RGVGALFAFEQLFERCELLGLGEANGRINLLGQARLLSGCAKTAVVRQHFGIEIVGLGAIGPGRHHLAQHAFGLRVVTGSHLGLHRFDSRQCKSRYGPQHQYRQRNKSFHNIQGPWPGELIDRRYMVPAVTKTRPRRQPFGHWPVPWVTPELWQRRRHIVAAALAATPPKIVAVFAASDVFDAGRLLYTAAPYKDSHENRSETQGTAAPLLGQAVLLCFVSAVFTLVVAVGYGILTSFGRWLALD